MIARDRARDERLARPDLHGVGGQANGSGTITLSFEPGTNADLAQVDVQNRLARATPRLPAAVTQQGVRVDKARTQLPAVHHPLVEQPGLRPDRAGRLRGAQRAARDPARARRRPGAAVRHRARDAHLDRPGQAAWATACRAADVVAAIRGAERAGRLGHHRRPAQRRRPGASSATVVVRGQLTSAERVRQHRAARQRRRLHGAAGATSRASSSARRATRTSARLNGKPSTGIGVQLSPSGNALATAEAIRTSAWTNCSASSRRA